MSTESTNEIKDAQTSMDVQEQADAQLPADVQEQDVQAPMNARERVVPTMPDGAAHEAQVTQGPKKKGKKGSGAHAKAAQSAYIQRSARMRKILIVVIILLVVILAAIGVFAFQAMQSAQDAANQQTQTTEVETGGIESETGEKDAASTATKKTTVPNLVSLLGHTTDEAVAALAHGAEVTHQLEVNEEGNPVKMDVQIALTEEPSDSRTGTPTVYLSLDEGGYILEAGYSVAISSLGYGTVSFSDAVTNENIVENTLGEAGLTVNVGTAKLPEDKMEYSTYASDGVTLVKEYCSFTGTGMADGVEHSWEAILSYDYTVANATDNLNDTIRTIFVYVS